jgi:2-hydroxycyclohexanecarboxyl-CoA dehydrogenase
MNTPPAFSQPRIAIVTGGASGIGLAVAHRLAAEGAAVAIFDLDEKAAGVAAEEIAREGGSAQAWSVDVSDRGQIDSAVAEVAGALGPPTILVNSAGLTGFDEFLTIGAETWNRILAVNLTGTFDCCQAVVPHMIEAGWGRIINISSSSGQNGSAGMTHYSAAKAGVIGFTKALADELGPRGITVNTIPPGSIDTPMLRGAEEGGFLGHGIDALGRTLPVRRIGIPDDIAAACAFLVREDAGYVTGQTVGVNGGRIR